MPDCVTSTHQLGPASAPSTTSDSPTSLPIRIGLSVLSIVLVVGSIAIGTAFGRRPHRPRPLADLRIPTGDFHLTNWTGEPVTRSTLEGRALVVHLVDTGCGLSCLQVAAQLQEVQVDLDGNTNVLLVALTLDPRSDTPPVLARFASRFGARTNRWQFLTGSRSSLAPLVEGLFGKPMPTGVAPGNPGDTLDIGEVLVVDRQGQVRGRANGFKTNLASVVLDLIRGVDTPAIP